MPLKFTNSPGEVIATINASPIPVIVHYWASSTGSESPFLPMFLEANERRGDEVYILIVNSGFIVPPHSPDEMPLTVLYKGGEEVETAPFDPSQTQELIDRA